MTPDEKERLAREYAYTPGEPIHESQMCYNAFLAGYSAGRLAGIEEAARECDADPMGLLTSTEIRELKERSE